MKSTLRSLLQCPECSGDLLWSNEELRSDLFIVNCDIICSQCNKKYIIKDEIGYFLTDLERNDLWEQSNSNLLKYLHDNPLIEKKLLESPIVNLSPADIFFLSIIYEEKGDYERAEELHTTSQQLIYTKEYYNCFKSQINYVSSIKMSDEPILDIASGKGYLVFELIKKRNNHILMSDFSPTIIRANYNKLLHFKLLDRVSLFVFDARKTPFKDGSIELMTSNVGLNNIEKPLGLLKELKRILHGDFYSIMNFFQENDLEHKKFIAELNLVELNFLKSALEEFSKVNFRVSLENTCHSFCKPTPEGEIIKGGIDGLPIHDTTIQWSVVHAK